MDSSLDGGAAGDSSKSTQMSVDAKRQLVYELSKQSHLATEVLQAWSRQEILQILCAEMGKERKYTGLTKVKIIEALLKIVSEKNSGEYDEKKQKKRDSVERNSKRQRKLDEPTRYVAPPTSNNNASGSCNSVNTTTTLHCNNLACRAVLRQEDSFCRRCSCCICLKYDDNKDPSLWLTCSSDPPFESGDSCGFSCHLECAFKSEKSGLASGGDCFYCVSCGKPNSLLECWKKQLTIAKETRRVDVLCYRLLLLQKLIKGCSSSKLCEYVNEAVKSLEADVGTLTTKMGRGIVNRLQSGPDVQKLCSYALESLQTPPEATALPSPMIRFEDLNATSLTVILASSESPLTNCSTLSSNPSSVEAERVEEEEEEEEAVPDKNGEALVPVTKTRNGSDASLPITPFRSDQTKNRQGRNGKSVKENGDHHSANGGSESGLEHCVKIVRQLECSGHVEKEFRQKFLTWYGLRATPQEVRVVKIFIDTFADDPVALAEQLVHSFSDRVSSKRSAVGGGASAVVQSGFCTKLWH